MTEDNNDSSRNQSWTAKVVAAVIGYVLPFAIVYLDEAVLETNYSRYAPDWTVPIFRAVYFPFYWFLGR
jgi:hypothetical protein